jgi:transketolase
LLNSTSAYQMITRETVIDELIPYFEDKRYILLICDMGFSKVDKLKALYPDRVINCGIMEQGTVGIASGMAEVGLIPIVYSIASFLVYRALEQIRNDIVLRQQNVKLIGNGSGDFFRGLGRCHTCKEDDVKLMRIISMPVYKGNRFKEWICSSEGGYFRC